ncbi:MAG: hypothetical protein NC184_06380 [Roseburia sp.]|nr:hypothetical protein [Roseburia sp.]
MHITGRLKNKFIAAVLSAAILITMLFGAFYFSHMRAYADTEDTSEYRAVSVNPENPHFSSTSGSYPATPDSWTVQPVGSGNVITGVVDLTATTYVGTDSGNKKFKLDQYKEYKSENSIPQTIFGNTTERPGTDAKTLLINTANGAESAYLYKSTDLTFEPNSFYRVSVWVKTGDFASNTGATVKLGGLGQNCSFLNINTVKNIERDGDGIPVLTKENNYGWDDYTFYIRTSAVQSKTVNLYIGIGDSTVDDDDEGPETARLASGYAFFDTVSADRISAYDFAFSTSDFTATDRDGVYTDATGTSLAFDLYDNDYLLTSDDVEIGTFSHNTEKWYKYPSYSDDDDDDDDYIGNSVVEFYNSQMRVTPDDNDYGFTKNPWSPLGRAEYDAENTMFTGDNGNILLISTYDGDSFGTAARGVASPDVVIERFKYYRFSVWVKGDSVTDGAGISVGIKGEKNDTESENKLAEWYTGLTGADDDTAHYGWKEHNVYIQGSVLSDLTVHFELWLGSPQSQSRGIAMFDNVTFTEIPYSDYSERPEDANALVLDGSANDTGVTNGNFMSVGDYDELTFPLPVADWTYYTPDTVETTGFCYDSVNTDNAVHGIIPTDDATFARMLANGSIPASVRNPSKFDKPALYNTLLLSSTTKTAFCYRSGALTVVADNGYKLNVDLAVDGVTNGYGASLVLKSGNDVISTIENITTTNSAFKTFTFYIDAPLSEKSVSLEIWLGLNDRTSNTLKLSNGNVYVKQVEFAEWTVESDDSGETTTVAQEYSKLLAQYLSDIAIPSKLKALDYGLYSFNAPTLNYYDAYTYYLQDGLTTPYHWSVKSENTNVKTGIFNTDNMKSLSIYDGFDRKDQTGAMFLINNTLPNSTTVTYGNTVSLVSNTYYRLDVTIKVRLSDEMKNDDKRIGASINLTGTKEESFTNIKDTTTLIAQGNEDSRDGETFKTFTFFIASGESGGDVGLNISFGGDDRFGYIEGQLIIADISMTSITNTTFDTAEEELDSDYQKAVRLSSTDTDTTDDTTEKTTSDIAWWILPTVIFGACLIAAIVIILVVRLRDRAKKKKKTVYASEYDRSDTIKEIEKLQAQKARDDELAQQAEAQEEPENADGEAEAEEDTDTSPSSPEAEVTETEEAPKSDETSDAADSADGADGKAEGNADGAAETTENTPTEKTEENAEGEKAPEQEKTAKPAAKKPIKRAKKADAADDLDD